MIRLRDDLRLVLILQSNSKQPIHKRELQTVDAFIGYFETINAVWIRPKTLGPVDAISRTLKFVSTCSANFLQGFCKVSQLHFVRYL